MTTSFITPYLGNPGAMQALPPLTGQSSAPPTRGEALTRLASGGLGINRRLYSKKSYSLPYQWSDPCEADTLIGFYEGVFGNGPFVYVDPYAINVLGLDVSTCGVRSNADDGWVSGSGTLALDTSTAPPYDTPTSGVLTWTSPATAGKIQPGTISNTADITTAPVWVPDLPTAGSLYVKASAAHAAMFMLGGYDATGTLNCSTIAVSFTLSTSWQRVAAVAAPYAADFTAAGSVFVLPRLSLATGTPPASISIAAAQLEYNDETSPWRLGRGARRVSITSSPGDDTQLLGYSDHTLTLGEP